MKTDLTLQYLQDGVRPARYRLRGKNNVFACFCDCADSLFDPDLHTCELIVDIVLKFHPRGRPPKSQPQELASFLDSVRSGKIPTKSDQVFVADFLKRKWLTTRGKRVLRIHPAHRPVKNADRDIEIIEDIYRLHEKSGLPVYGDYISPNKKTVIELIAKEQRITKKVPKLGHEGQPIRNDKGQIVFDYPPLTERAILEIYKQDRKQKQKDIKELVNAIKKVVSKKYQKRAFLTLLHEQSILPNDEKDILRSIIYLPR